ncbi:MAG: Cof-type HAD-IIB family hydrolase [Lachnospiraceae bacterium]|nr:Cof-type HAD-IIB family hydrolase [Lachnospiraceae bacterium]
MNPERKIFFFDLDGTLLNTEKQITPDTYRALQEWHAAGHVLAISSGRPLKSICDVIESQKLKEFAPVAIAYNGSQIRDCESGRDLLVKRLPMEDVRTVTALTRELSLYCHSYGDDTIYTPREGEELLFYTRVVKLPHHLLPDFPEGLPDAPCKLLCIDLAESGKLTELSEAISERTNGRVSCVLSNPWYLEIFRSDAGKGAAVTELASILGIPVKNTFAAGDAENDISMIEAAGCGIAMCNGQAGAIASADIVTERDNDHDGLAPLLRSFI